MKNELEIINPDRTVKVGTEDVVIKELTWLNAMTFLTKLAKSAGSFITTDGRLVITSETISKLVTDSKELADELLKSSTGKDQAWIDGLRFEDGINVLEKSVELNVRPDFFVKIKALASRVGTALGIKKRDEADGGASSISSSITGIVGKT